MSQSITTEPVIGDFNAYHRYNQCTGIQQYWGLTTFRYNKMHKVSNDIERRPKPNPLTDTAQQLQMTSRARPSEIPHDELVTSRIDKWCGGVKKYEYTWTQAKGLGNDYGSGVPPLIPAVEWESRLLQAVRDDFVTIGDSLAEYKATAKMFEQYARGMYSVGKRLRNLRTFRTRLAFCSIPLAELAYSFGVAPLVEDTFSTYEALRLRLQSPIYKDYFKTSNGYASDSPDWSGYTAVQRRCRVSVRVNATYQLHPYDNVITVSNPVSWAWELVPFSFVVDWGIPIGQWLLDLDAIRLMEGIKGTRTIKRSYTSYFRISRNNFWGTPIVGSLGKFSLKDHERKLLTSVPIPPFPRWKPSYSWHKVYRAMTLLVAVRGCEPRVRKPRVRPWKSYRDFYGDRS